jgi:pantoate--beta-alanine ligase
MPQESKTDLPSRAEPAVIRAIPDLRAAVARARESGGRVALVHTMGALHAGHLQLVRMARQKADHVVVSIFVNPAQFGPNEDFSSYPRTWDADLAALAQFQIDAVWAPSIATMYPEGLETRIAPGGPAVVGLEDKFRPHFFGGVCTVVAKLLLQVQPDFATFGEKDYQQLQVVTAMTRDLDMPVTIVAVPTVREHDGLAMSSRNAYLAPDERLAAPALYRVLQACAARLKDGGSLGTVMTEGRQAIERAGFTVDYFEARHADSLRPIGSLTAGPVRLLVAAKIGRTRLIDNIAV